MDGILAWLLFGAEELENMVLDTATLRIAFGLMALGLVFLFYFGTYRPTRSPYTGGGAWRCCSFSPGLSVSC